MDAAQRYLWDLHGFLVVEQALSRSELDSARAAAYSATSVGEPFAVHCTPELAAMPFHPKIWPIVLELTVRHHPQFCFVLPLRTSTARTFH